MSQPTKRVITAKDRENARRLRAIWNRQKSLLNLNQTKLGKLCGYTQPTVNQYINAVIPLNTDAVFKFAAALRVNPTEIAPDFENVSPLFRIAYSNQSEKLFAVIGSTSGGKVMQKAQLAVDEGQLDPEGTYAAIIMDTSAYSQSAGLPKGTHVLVDLLADPFKLKHVNVMIRRMEGNGFEMFRLDSTSRLNLKGMSYLTMEPTTIPRSEVYQVFKVHATIQP